MRIITICACLLFMVTAQAQNSVEELLLLVEAANPDLRAQNELTTARKLDAKTGNYLSNPSIEYEHLWGKHPGSGLGRELTVSQEFDFPTVYSNRSRIAKLKSEQYDYEKAAFRQEVLLQAKEVCIDLVYLHRKREFLDERLFVARKLSESYALKLAAGNAGVLEINRIELELINIQTEVDLNEVEISAKLAELTTLNGGEEIRFNIVRYPDDRIVADFEVLLALCREKCPELKHIESEQKVAGKEVALNKANALPKFELGYKGDYSGGEKFNGVLVGMSIPMFENKNTIKRAKAQARFAEIRHENASLVLRAELQKLYDQAQALNASRQKVSAIMERFGDLTLLNKALEAGQISLIECLNELAPRYQSKETLLLLERDCQLALARLYKFEL